MPNGPAAWVGLELGAKAGVHCVASACATGAEAIALGLDIIRSGRADVVVAGGTEAVIHPLPIAGFASMRAMSTRNDDPEQASRPWDKGRDGFVLGEGAAVVVLERADHAAARGARVYARLAGSGITSDGFDIVQPHPEGAGFVRAVSKALDDADLTGARHRPRQRPRHVDSDRRHGRGGRPAARHRRPPGAHRDEVDDRPPARRGRSAGDDRHDPRHPRRRRAAHHQPGRPRGGPARRGRRTSRANWRSPPR